VFMAVFKLHSKRKAATWLPFSPSNVMFLNLLAMPFFVSSS